MVSSYRPHQEADAFERAVAAYLRACGYRTFGESSNHKSGRAPLVSGGSGDESYASADIPAIKNGHGAFFEVKWKSSAFVSKYGNVCTGIDLDSYRAYLEHEIDSGWPVVIVFCHRKENEVRCATLAFLKEIESHRCSDSHYRNSKGGMINWKYDQIPLWMPYAELAVLARSYKETSRASSPGSLPFEIRQPSPEGAQSTSASDWHRSHDDRQTSLGLDYPVAASGMHQADHRTNRRSGGRRGGAR